MTDESAKAERYKGKLVEEWLEDLVSHDGGARLKAVEVVEELGPLADGAIAVLAARVKRYASSEKWRGLMPAEALLQVGRHVEDAGRLILDCLCDEASSDVRSTAYGSIAKNGRSAAPLVPALTRVLRENGRGEIRALAAAALGGIGPSARESLSQLRLARSDAEEAVREAAQKAIESIERSG